MELKNISWVEKYRPNKINHVISDHTHKILQAIKNPMAIQNYLFYSRVGGTGKTSMMKAIQNELQCDYLNLNASEERSIEIIRTRVKDFMRTKSNNSNSKKMIMLDEGEKLTKDAMDALKNMVEEYSNNTFFIITTNNIDKIPQPMQTRFNIMYFVKPNKQQIFEYLENICKKENLEYDVEGINKLIDLQYPSIRSMIQILQDLKLSEKSVKVENITTVNDEFVKLWSEIENKQYNSILQKCHKNEIDVGGFTNWCFEHMINYNDTIKKIKIIQILRDLLYDLKMGVDEAPAFMAHVGRMMVVFK